MYSKYNNKKTHVDGIEFDSKRESERYQELKLLARAGKISHLELQPRFLLLEPFKYDGKTVRKMEYVADFKYIDEATGLEIVEDVKSKATITPVYKLKKKLFLYNYGERYKFVEVF